ncbi:heavy-metal-associated domain-containing protein, partial [uncultured Dubosiella sp.]
MMKETFDVTGMTCAACQANVTKAVQKLPGVQKVDVSLMNNTMKVLFDEKLV